MAKNNVVEILIQARDEATSKFNGLKTALVGVASVVAGYFGVSLFADAVKGAADLETGMSRIKAASGASAKEMQGLKKAAEDAGGSTKFTAIEAASALETLVKSGLSAKDAIAALEPVLNLAQAGDIALAQSAEYVSQAVKGMGLQFTDAARVADVLAQGANASSTSVTGLAQALSYTAPVANAAKLSLEETVAIIGKFADSGIDASRAGTALNAILSQFIDPASKFRQELAGAGIVTGDFNVALRQLAAAGTRGQQAILAVGLEAGPALRALLNQGIGALDDLKGKLDQSSGSAKQTAAVMENNLKGAFSGLSSAWDSLKIALGEPVLPVLTDAVKQLTSGISSAVSSGTIGQFGAAIATSFKSAIDWVKGFVAAVDFKLVIAQLQDFASKTGQVMSDIGQKASEAGNTVRLAYNVMAAGTNTVLAVIYKLGEGFAVVAAGVQKGLALLYEASSKITFGGLSDRYKAIAAEIRLSADATAASAEAMGKKSAEAFQAAAKSGEGARAAFTSLSSAATTATAAQKTSSNAIENMVTQLQQLGTQAASAGQKQVDSANKTRETVAALKAEYAAAIAAGDIQLAAQKQQQLRDELKKTTGQATVTKDALQSAFDSLGIVSQAKLKESADAAQNLFNILKASGQATALDLKNAFGVLAQRTLEAAGAVGSVAREAAQSALVAKAAAEGLSLEFDAAGKVMVRAMGEGAKATDALNEKIGATTEALRAQEEATDRLLMKSKLRADYTERQIALEEKELALIERKAELERKRLNVDKEGFSIDKSGNRVVATESQDQLNSRVASRYGAEFATDARAIRASNIQQQIDLIRSGISGQNSPETTSLLAELARLENEISRSKSEAQTSSGGNRATSPASSSSGSTGAVNTYYVKVDLPGRKTQGFNAASQSDAANAAALIRDLAQAKLAA